MDKRIVVVCGPTATGKSALALALARRFGGAVVGADSMQVYEGLPIGTAAVTPEEAGGVPLRLMGFLPWERAYSVADWLADARRAIDGLLAEGLLPVVCGGTGLYLKSLLEGTCYAPEKPDAGLRAELEARWQALGAEAMLAELARTDPARAAALNPADKKRVLRALELRIQTGRTAEEREADSKGAPPYRALCLGLNTPERAALYAAIDARVDAMLAAGLPEEARRVYARWEGCKTVAQAIGYKELFPFFEGAAPLEACVARLKQATRNYAKRQLTWFGKMEGIHWLEAGRPEAGEEAAALVRRFLADGPDDQGAAPPLDRPAGKTV